MKPLSCLSKELLTALHCEDATQNILFDEEDIVFPERKENSHKGNFGRVTVIGGSKNYIGAPYLATRAATCALATGAGLVTLAVPKSLELAYSARATEFTLCPLSDEDGFLSFEKAEFENAVCNSDVVVFGTGIGKTPSANKITEFLCGTEKTVVLDADALNAMSENVGGFYNEKNFTSLIITPHLAEFSRLIKKPISEISPLRDAKEFATAHNLTVHLKGAASVTATPESVVVTASGTPALAKGGSGDVLSGIIAATVAQKIDFPVPTASVLHGLSARKAEEKFSEYGVLARDVCDGITNVISLILEGKYD